ncbi:MAG: 1-acyl-sn-glycerol-3-phosphate acyltransferase [Oscillospiraceae bacterium]|nr:1-acyl-sn-glycerol-3-phosphate acyltransferase [Oscillospiraceae bacterium]
MEEKTAKTERQQERQLRRHRWIWNHLGLPVRLLVWLRHRRDYAAEPAPALEGPYLVLPNHANAYDQFFVALSFLKRHMYFVASEHAFRQKLVGFIMRSLLAPISRVKGSADASAVRSILRTLRRGVPVCLFPEGNRSWDGRSQHLHPATGKLLKLAKVPVVTYRITGGYLADPRWGRSIRRGPIRGGVVRVYQPEELAGLSPEEITLLVERDLWVDSGENALPYPGKRLADGLEEALFLCPKCGRVGALHGRERVFSCDCGLRAEYREDGHLGGDIPFAAISAWDAWQQDQLRELGKRPDFSLSDEAAELRELGEGHRISVLGRGRLTLDRKGLAVAGVLLPLDHMQEPSLCHFGSRETMMFTARGKTYELLFPRPKKIQPPSIRKYQLLLLDLLEERRDAGEDRAC